MVRTFVGDSTMRSLDADFPVRAPREALLRVLPLAVERFEAALFGFFLSFIYFSCPLVVIRALSVDELSWWAAIIFRLAIACASRRRFVSSDTSFVEDS